MKVTTHVQIDVLSLFVHDQWSAGTLSGWSVARAIQEALRRSCSEAHDAYGNLLEWEVKSPDETGLDRFTLWRGGKPVAEKRLRSEEEVRSAFDPDVLSLLEELDRGNFVLDGEGGLSPAKPERPAKRSAANASASGAKRRSKRSGEAERSAKRPAKRAKAEPKR